MTVNDVQQVNQTAKSRSDAHKYDLRGGVIESITLNSAEQVNDIVTVPALRQALESTDADVRKQAAEVLGEN